MRIDRLYWDAISIDTEIDPNRIKPHVFVFWPGPVESDPCFVEAGFLDFTHIDTPWKKTWRGTVDSAIRYLRHFGTPLLRHAVIKQTPLDKIKKLFRPFTHHHYKDPSLTDLVNLCSRQDGHPPAIIDFGDEHGLTLMSADGHPLLWVLVDSRINFSPEHMAHAITPGVPLERRTLNWPALLPGKARHGNSKPLRA